MARIRTYSPKAADLHPGWRVVDAEGETLGRLATRIATILRGKDKPTFTRHMAVGDFVIVVNAQKVRVTGQKARQKIYYRHTQYPGGLRAVPYAMMMDRRPERIIEHAVKGMLPHNRLGRQLMRRLHVYAGPEHPHQAQIRAGEGKRVQRREAQIRAQQEALAAAAAKAQEESRAAPRRRRRSARARAADAETPTTGTAPETTAATETQPTDVSTPPADESAADAKATADIKEAAPNTEATDEAETDAKGQED